MANNSSSVVVGDTTPALCFISVTAFDPKNINRPDSVHPTWTFLATINGIAVPPTVVVNAIVIWAVLGDENLRCSPFNLLLVCLAVTDFLVGLLVKPLYCLFLVCLLEDCYSPCHFTVYWMLALVCCGMTMVALAAASFERYLAIEHPNFYQRRITRKKVLTGMTIAWLVGFSSVATSSAILNKYHPNFFRLPIMIVSSIFAVIILYCSSKVYLTAYRKRRASSLQAESVQQPDEQEQQKQQLEDYKRVFTMTMLVGMSGLSYISLGVVRAIEAVKGKDVTSDFQYIAVPICVTLIHLQSLINPIIMSLRLSYIRQRIKNMFFQSNEN